MDDIINLTIHAHNGDIDMMFFSLIEALYFKEQCKYDCIITDSDYKDADTKIAIDKQF